MIFPRFLQLSWWAFIICLTVPIAAGLVGVVLPALGYFPALGFDHFSLAPLQDLLATPGLWKMVWLSATTALISTCLALVGCIGLVAGLYNHRIMHYLQHLFSPVLVIPHAAAAIAVAFLLSPSGLISRWLSPELTGWELPPLSSVLNDSYGIGMIVAFTLKELPFLLLMTLSVLAQPAVKHKLAGQLAVARSMGYRPSTAFLKVALPVIYPQIKLPLLAVLAYASASVEIPLILGPGNPPTLAVAILHWFNSITLSLRLQASVAAVLQLMVTLSVIGFWLAAERAVKPRLIKQLHNSQRGQGDTVVKAIAGVVVAGFSVALVVICGSLLLWSVAAYWPYPESLPGSATMIHWEQALRQLRGPLANTLWLGVGVSGVAVIVVLLALEAEQYRAGISHKWVNTVLFIPLIVPGVAFLYGLVWFSQLLVPSQVWLPTIISHLVYVLPYVFLSLAVVYRKFDSRYISVAYGLGVSPAKAFIKVRLPMLFAPIMVAFALGMAISFSQYLPTLLMSGGQVATLTTEAVSAMSGGSRRLSAVYVILQMLLPLAGFIAAWLLPTLLFNPKGRRRG